MEGFIATLNNITPLGLILLCLIIILQLIKRKREIGSISNNHLSGLPGMESTINEMASNTKDIKDLLQTMNNNIIYIKARVNGHDKDN